jgi:hypothetical protein
VNLAREKILEVLDQHGPQTRYADAWTDEHHIAFAQGILEAASAQRPDISEFEELLDDLAGAVAETAVFNVTQRSMTVRMVRPRRIAVLKFVSDLVARVSNRQQAGYVMKHKTGPARGFSWDANDKQFSADWIRIPAFIEQNEQDKN